MSRSVSDNSCSSEKVIIRSLHSEYSASGLTHQSALYICDVRIGGSIFAPNLGSRKCHEISLVSVVWLCRVGHLRDVPYPHIHAEKGECIDSIGS